MQTEPGACRDNSLRVLYARTHYWFGLTHGGSIAHTAGVLDALAKQAKVEILSNEQIYGVDQIPCTVVSPIGRGWRGELLYNFKFSRFLKQKIQTFKPDFVYHRYNGFSFATASVCKKLGIPLVLEFNSSHLWKVRYEATGIKARLTKPLNTFIFRRIEPMNLSIACIVVVVSEALKQTLVADGIPASRILVNPNGVNPDKFRSADFDRCAEIRKDLGIPGDRIVIGFAGTFGPWHGIPELTEAILRIKSVPRWRDRVCFVLYGRNSPLREEMEQRTNHLEDVIFAGSIEFDEISDYLSICDILLSPNPKQVDDGEFFRSPIKLFEYMALGKGIVANDLGQISTVLKHMDTGYLCTPDNVDELVQGIEYFLEHPEERARMGQNARSAILENYTWDHNVTRTIQAFRGIRNSETRAEA